MKFIGIIIFLFFLISSPLLLQRAFYFGSPTAHGYGGKYLHDDYSVCGAYNIPILTWGEYFRTRGVVDYFNKFFVKGFLGLIFDLFHGDQSYKHSLIISPLLIIFFIYGILLCFKEKFFPLFISILGFLGGLSIFHSIYSDPRYLEPTIPFILIFSSVGINKIFSKVRYKHMFLAIFLIVFSIFSLITPIGSAFLGPKITVPNWALWASENIQGKIGIVVGADLILMNLPDTMIGGRDAYTLRAPNSNLETIRPGLFDNLNDSMTWMKKRNVTHLIVDDISIERKPQYSYLKESYVDCKSPEYLNEIYSNYDTDEDPNWKVRIFEINWTAFSEN